MTPEPCRALFLLLLGTAGQLSDPPEAYRRMEQSRRSIESGEVRWVVTQPMADGSEVVSHYVSRYASRGDMICELRGDDDGWVSRDIDGRGVSRFPQLFLSTAGETWNAQETGLSACLDRRSVANSVWSGMIKDVRALGLTTSASSVSVEYGFGSLMGRTDDPPVEWSESTDGPIHIVTAAHRSGARSVWHIDSERGWNPLRSAYIGPRGSIWESVTSLEQFGGVWFPAEVTRFDRGEPSTVISVATAKLNQPDDPKRFGPADIGVEPGAIVAVQGERGIAPVWNGDRVVTQDEWGEQVERGERQPGAKIRTAVRDGYTSPYDTPEDIELRKLHARESRANAAIRRHQDLWERYTRDFIARYKLEQEQSEKAWTIYFSCRGEADKHLQRVRPEAMRLATELEAAREKKDEAKIAECDAKLKKLAEPIDEIFEKALKPSLDKLPTRAQRRAAEQTPATVPADRP